MIFLLAILATTGLAIVPVAVMAGWKGIER
jgi:hypothetical protein